MSKSNGFLFVFSFFFNDTATTEIYTLSLHDALPILPNAADDGIVNPRCQRRNRHTSPTDCSLGDRKSTRLNSSHITISYAVFCLKKKKKKYRTFINLQTKKNRLKS